ncbi:MAG: hypothetical protein HFH87_09270 [Lachnospiraceae bacterium]|nr:hypothetical protein [Lachnospiraceae bacterium]
MLSNEIANLERENRILKDALEELSKKMDQNTVVKPKSCQYCKNFIQHYRKEERGYTAEYVPVNSGFCVSGVPAYKGGKKRPAPDDTCPYFEIGTHDTKFS